MNVRSITANLIYFLVKSKVTIDNIHGWCMNFDEIEVIPIELDVKFTSDQHLNCLFFQPKIELEKEYGFERYIINERENHFDKIKHLMALSNNNQVEEPDYLRYFGMCTSYCEVS